MASSSPSQPLPDFTQEARALDEILDAFRSGNLTLESSLTLFEQGVGHLRACQQVLSQSRGRIETLTSALRQEGEALSDLADSLAGDDDDDADESSSDEAQ
ncbi:MAG: exodeoxyribonuclease VII small subunit [Vampirovibrionales bacterium]|nr:exodeoxyribonuclease VII small subunit [Vampirovibrionales bacterium]